MGVSFGGRQHMWIWATKTKFWPSFQAGWPTPWQLLCYLISSCGPCFVPSLLWLCLVIIVSGVQPGTAASSSHTLLMQEAEFINSLPRPIVWDTAWLFIYSNMVCIYSDRASEGTLFNFASPSAGVDRHVTLCRAPDKYSELGSLFFKKKCGLR